MMSLYLDQRTNSAEISRSKSPLVGSRIHDDPTQRFFIPNRYLTTVNVLLSSAVELAFTPLRRSQLTNRRLNLFGGGSCPQPQNRMPASYLSHFWQLRIYHSTL